jgi:hypothetical protein
LVQGWIHIWCSWEEVQDTWVTIVDKISEDASSNTLLNLALIDPGFGKIELLETNFQNLQSGTDMETTSRLYDDSI